MSRESFGLGGVGEHRNQQHLEAMVAGDLMTRSADGRAAFELEKEST